MSAGNRIRCVHLHVVVAATLLVLSTQTSAETLRYSNSARTRFPLDSQHWPWALTDSTGEVQVRATVPGDVFSDLTAAGVVGDPIQGFNDVVGRWVAGRNWSYSASFRLEDNVVSSGLTFDLVLEGVDTVAEVWLNGVHLVTCNSSWRQYRVNVNSVIVAGSNSLWLHFASPTEFAAAAATRHAATAGYQVPPLCPPASWHGECHFNFIRKPAYSFGWDWGPAVPTSGVWRPLYIDAYTRLAIDSVKFAASPLSPPEGDAPSPWQANVTVGLVASGNGGVARGGEYCLLAELPQLASGRAVACGTVPAGSGRQELTVELRFPRLTARPWWPNGHGQQRLHKLAVTLCTDGRACQHTSSETRQVGFRRLRLLQLPAGGGLSFLFEVNGRRIFARGANVVPLSVSLPTVPEAQYQRLLLAAAEAGVNLLRVWGGGTVERPIFYDLADRLGLLVWQDLPYACSLYPVDQHFLETAAAEAADIVRRLQHRPSLAVWAENNENEAALAENWWPMANSSRYVSDYRQLYAATLRPVLLREDTSDRPLLLSSPSNGAASEAAGGVADNPQSWRFGDVHFYNYNADLWRTENLPLARFVSEFGVQSLPSLLTVLTATDNVSDVSVDSEFSRHRQHRANGTQEMLGHNARHFAAEEPLWLAEAKRPQLLRLMRRLGVPQSEQQQRLRQLSQYAYQSYVSQADQAQVYKLVTDWHVQHSCQVTASGLGGSGGSMFWQLNDVWSAPSWSTIEQTGAWKAAQFSARRFYGNRRLVALQSGGRVSVQFVQHSGRPPAAGASVQFACQRLDSFRPVAEWNRTLRLAPAAGDCPLALSEQLLLQPLPSLLSRCGCRQLADCVLTAALGHSVREHFFFASPKEFRRRATVNWTAAQTGKRQFSIRLEASSPVYMLHLQFLCRELATASLSDNSFHLTEPTRTLRLTVPEDAGDVRVERIKECLLLHYL